MRKKKNIQEIKIPVQAIAINNEENSMGVFRSFLMLLMFVALLAMGGVYVQGSHNLAGWLAVYGLLTGAISLHYVRMPLVARVKGFFIQHALPWIQTYLWMVLGLAAVLFFLVGQSVILKAATALRPELYAKNLIQGATYSVLGLISGVLSYWLKGRPLTVKIFPGYGFLLLALLLGFSAWSGFFIFKSSFDMAEQGRYFSLFDDAMISLRYAWNLTHGMGLVWNPGEHVEGYTNLLMTLYMAVGTLFLNKNLSVLFIQLSGVVFLLVIAWLHVKLANRMLGRLPVERKKMYLALAFASPLFYYPLAFWSIMGMETGLLCLLVSAGVWIVFADSEQPRFRPWLAVLLGLITLVRPDAVVQVGLIFLYRLFTVLAARKNLLGVVSEGLIFAVFPLGQLGFRLAYYHEWYPNTYLLKVVGFPLDARLAHGKKFVLMFMESAWLLTGASLLSLLLKFRKEKLLLLALFASVNVYQVYIGGDPWLYWRIMAPYVGLLLISCLDLLDSAAGLIANRFKPGGQSIFHPLGIRFSAVLLVWFVLLASLNLKYLPEIYFKELPYSVDFNGHHVRIGLTLAKVCTPEAKVGVIWAGTIPYYSGLQGVDFLGKCDKTIASLPAEVQGAPGHNKYDLKYSIEKLKPDYVQQYFWQGSDERTYVEANYVIIGNMWFMKNSPNVRWDQLKQ